LEKKVCQRSGYQQPGSDAKQENVWGKIERIYMPRISSLGHRQQKKTVSELQFAHLNPNKDQVKRGW
jgi:hypothetical protein